MTATAINERGTVAKAMPASITESEIIWTATPMT